MMNHFLIERADSLDVFRGSPLQLPINSALPPVTVQAVSELTDQV